MKFLLTSAGISNTSIHNALVELPGKPIAESNALFIPTAIYPFPRGAGMGWQAISGKAKSPLCQLGWKSMGLLELTALPSIDKKVWVPSVEEADALLVWGGDVLYLCDWMRRSGLTDLFQSLRREMVYVGVSAGSMAIAYLRGDLPCPAQRQRQRAHVGRRCVRNTSGRDQQDLRQSSRRGTGRLCVNSAPGSRRSPGRFRG